MRTILHRLPAGFAAAYLLAVLAGCSGDNTAAQVAAVNTSNIQRLANMYSAFQNYKGGGGKGSVAAVVFEEAGKEGKKQFAFTGTGSKVEDLDDAAYAQLWSGKSRPAADPKEGGRPTTGAPVGAPKGPPGGIPKGPP